MQPKARSASGLEPEEYSELAVQQCPVQLGHNGCKAIPESQESLNNMGWVISYMRAYNRKFKTNLKIPSFHKDNIKMWQIKPVQGLDKVHMNYADSFPHYPSTKMTHSFKGISNAYY